MLRVYWEIQALERDGRGLDQEVGGPTAARTGSQAAVPVVPEPQGIWKEGFALSPEEVMSVTQPKEACFEDASLRVCVPHPGAQRRLVAPRVPQVLPATALPVIRAPL